MFCSGYVCSGGITGCSSDRNRVSSVDRASSFASSASSTAASASSTAAPAEKKEFTFADTVRWDAQYDVVVMGMGAAGMVAAKTAADNGAKVVIVEKCEEGKAGGKK